MAPLVENDVALGRNLALALVATSTTPLLLLDDKLNVVAASASFCTIFRIDPGNVSGKRLVDLGAGEWNVVRLLSLLRTTSAGHAAIENYEMDFPREGEEPRRLVLSAQRLHYTEGADIRLVLSIADVTDARIALKRNDDLLRDKDVLLQELHHRVANSLQIIASVLMQSARKVESEESRSHLRDAHHRVMSVAALQRQLAATKQGDVELRPYLKALCESIGASMIHDHDKISLAVTADESITTADTSVSLGLIVTELVINALKHAFPGDRSGKILVDYRSRGVNWTLSVNDDGVGMSADRDNAKPGLGTSIVEALAKQLGSRVDVAGANPGTKISVVHVFVPALVGSVATASRAV